MKIFKKSLFIDILKNSLKLEEQTGVLQIVKALPPATYDFKISAKIDSGIHSEADVSLIIDHIVVCDAKNSKFQYSQIVKHVAEGSTGEIFAPATPADKCVYKIAHQEPKGGMNSDFCLSFSLKRLRVNFIRYS